MTLCDYAENHKKREGRRKSFVRVAASHVKGDERRMKVKMEKVIDITKKCFYIYNSFVVYLQSNRHENCDVILSLSTLVHFSTPVLPLVTSCNKHSISLKRAFITEIVQNVVVVFRRKKQKHFISQILLKHNQWEEWQIATLEEGCPPRITFLTRGNFHELAYFARCLCGEYWLLAA